MHGLYLAVAKITPVKQQKPLRQNAETALLPAFQGKTKPPTDKILFINRW
jgi:hypothetical protein